MVGFLIAALISFAVVIVATSILDVAVARLNPEHRALGLGFAAGALVVIAAAVVFSPALLPEGYGAIRWLETSAGFRAFLGAIFGLMAAFLVRGWRRAEREGGGTDAPWWARASGLIPVALTSLFVFAVIAPRGEFDLGFLSSVKTPFVEAQFNRNETEHRLQIESEPAGFFVLGRSGLGEALYLAWADLYYWDALAAAGGGPVDAQTAEAKRRDAALALEFELKVLQPIAACIRQGDALLGDQTIATDVLGRIGHGLARALILAKETPMPSAGDDGPDPVVDQLDDLESTMAEAMAPLMPVLAATAGPDAEYTHNLCDRGDVIWGEPDRSIEATDAEVLRRALQLPASIHAASMFFLWSGNPRAAATVLARTPSSRKVTRYPGTDFARGFTTRWTDPDNPSPSAYLDRWQDAIDIVQARLNALEAAHPDVVSACRGERIEREVLRSVYPISPPPEDDEGGTWPLDDGDDTWERRGLAGTPAGQLCGATADAPEKALPCKIRLAYGYYTHYLHKLRNHLVYETARELMTGREMTDDKELLLRQARVQAEALEAFVAADGYRRGNCETWLDTRVAAGGARTEPVTEADAETQYALNLDSVGLLTLAAAVRDDDPDGIERALGLFERSLDRGGNFGPGIRLTVRGHRRQARSFLGLQD